MNKSILLAVILTDFLSFAKAEDKMLWLKPALQTPPFSYTDEELVRLNPEGSEGIFVQLFLAKNRSDTAPNSEGDIFSKHFEEEKKRLVDRITKEFLHSFCLNCRIDAEQRKNEIVELLEMGVPKEVVQKN